MTTETLSPAPIFRSWDNQGNPLVGGLLNTYAAGTSTPLATYTDSTGGTPNANPVVLNARGEAQVWIPANTAYKFVLTDAAANLIWSVDNISNSALLSLYGGVDTGTANAYILTFTAPYTSLVDGTIIYWVPAHTNTGASNLTVNSLSPVNIKNQDGSTLLAGQLIANERAAVILQGGVAYLLYTAAGSPIVMPTMDIQARGVAICKHKAADTSRDNTNTGALVVNDPDLVYAIPAAGTYRLELFVMAYQSAAGSVGIQWNINYSGTITNTASYLVVDLNDGPGGAFGPGQVSYSATVNNGIVSVSELSHVAGTGYMHAAGVITVSTTGTLAFAWGQNTGDAKHTIVPAGSMLTITQLS